MRLSTPTPLRWLFPALLTLAVLLAAPRPAAAAWSNDVANANAIGLSWTNSSSALDNPMVPDGLGGFWAGSSWQNGFTSVEYTLSHVSSSGAVLAAVSSEIVAGSSKTALSLVPDNGGGVYAVWRDARGSGDIYAQRYSSSAVRQWTVGGLPVCNNVGAQSNPVATRSASGLPIVAWTDMRNGDADLYAQAINTDGSGVWAFNGVPIVVQNGSAQDSVTVTADEQGGAVFVWQDWRNSGTTGVDLYAQRLTSAGAVSWTGTPTGALVSNAAGNASAPKVVLLGSWFFTVWEEDRGLGTGHDIYAQHLTSFGGSGGLGNGVVVCNASGDQLHPCVTADGLGGVIVAWDDARNLATTNTDIYVQRMGSGGIAQWSANGVTVCTAIEAQANPHICSDAANGAIIGWCDNRTGFSDVYARRVLSTGSATWTTNGVPVLAADWLDGSPMLVPDGANGAFFTCGSNHLMSGGSSVYAIYAQRIDRFGIIGSPEPTIAKVKDVPNDQGGVVRVSWNASYLDALPNNRVDEYWVWREAPVFAMQAGARALPAASGRTEPMRRAVPSASGVIYWERIAVVPATALAGYSVVAATTSDSIGGSNPRTRFQVEAHQFSTEYFWASAPDSGYSVDNLGPAAPSPQYAIYSGGSTRLGWLPNHEADLMGYEVHRGSSASFTPSPATFVTSQPDTGLVDAAGAPYFYKLVAVDVHGNRSPVATLAPTGTLDAPGGGVAHAFFAAPSPNPVRGGTTLRFGLARGGAAKLAIYDAAGRLVRTLHAGTLAAGEHAMRWDSRGDGGGDVAPGLYLARLETPGAAAMVRRIVVTQ